ncbi:hypothetical protein LCGC14_0619890 [marine sediment metagenome]|uniref:Uncharacterized protein n=1 Tax=marine sediment metagenome TaxID=412755 RepID=A0A0F9RPD4_9ZZZZ
MGDYAATISTPLKKAERITRSLGIYSGKYNLTNYNTTLIKQTSITKYFATGGVAGFTQGIIAVVVDGISDNGHNLQWDYTTGAFKAYKPTQITLSGSATGGNVTVLLTEGQFAAASTAGTMVAAGIEAATDVDCGEVSFVAIGFMRG